MEAETEDTSLDGGGESLRGPMAAAALGGLAGALVGAARVLASRHGGEEDEADEPEEQEGAPEPRDEAEPRDEPESDDDDAEVEEEPAAEAGDASTPDEDEQEPEQKPSTDGASRAGGDLQKIVERATGQLAALTGREAESVLAVERTDDGWLLRLETVELERVPSSTDMLGAYEVELDGDGELRRYARVDRYVRSRSGDGGGS